MLNRRRLTFLGCSFAIGVFNGFNNFSLPLWLGSFVSSLVLISLLANTRGFIGSIISPLAGAWSDRIWLGWLGRRRPFILVGGLLAALLIALTPTLSRLPLAAGLPFPADWYRILPAMLVIFTITVSFNMMDDIHKAMLADLTEGRERNTVASWMVVTDMGGQVGVLLLGAWLSRTFGGDGVPDIAFAVTGALIASGVLVTVLGVREPAPAIWAASRSTEPGLPDDRLSLRSLFTEYRGALIFGLVIFSYWFGVNAVLPLISLYTKNILGATDAEAQMLPALLLLSTTVMAVPMGYLAGRLGKRRVISGGYIVMCLAALTGLLITTKEQGALLFLAAGIGNAASMVLTIPLLADLVPRRHMGAAAGLLAGAGGIAAPLSSLVAGSLADQFGERAIFAVMAVMVVIAFGLLQLVRPRTEEAIAVPVAGESAA